MRRIDFWVGLPVCLALTVARRCGDAWRRRVGRKPAAIERILIVKLAEQGATVLAYPALREAARLVGPQNVLFLVFEENRFILDCLNVIPEENVITIPTNGLLNLLGGVVRALLKLRRLRPDAALDFEFFARSSAILCYLSGAGVRVGLHGFRDGAPCRGDLMTHRIKYDPQLHTAQAYARMVGALALEPDDLPEAVRDLPPVEESLPEFRPSDEEMAAVRRTVQEQSATAHFSPLVLLNANASDLLPVRRWPSVRYEEVARRLLAQFPEVRVAFTGAPNEAAVAEELVAAVASPRCFSMAGKTTLGQLLALYCLADVLVTNDSGPAHFATLTPLHVITLFGPETPAVFGARGPRAHILWQGLPCSPCVNAYNNRLTTCQDNRCMRQIAVEEVLEATAAILRGGGHV
jgi:ADP-heptose:LPS heptosyltransferase